LWWQPALPLLSLVLLSLVVVVLAVAVALELWFLQKRRQS
jgi:hypothetical protein